MARPVRDQTEGLCRNGHDLSVLGTYATRNYCVVCGRAARARYRRTERGRAVADRYNNTVLRQLRSERHRIKYRVGRKLARLTELREQLQYGT